MPADKVEAIFLHLYSSHRSGHQSVKVHQRERYIWEKQILTVFQHLLEKDQEYGVIDIGSNIGKPENTKRNSAH